MAIWIIVCMCRIFSLILMYSALFNGSICIIFILREFYYHFQLHTSLNVLIITILTTDCIRALICTPFESYVMIKTWNTALINCQEKQDLIESHLIILNMCRLTSSIRSCFSIIQSFGFIAIAYERLRTIVQSNGHLNLNHLHQYQQHSLIRLKHAIIWICISLLLGIGVGVYRAVTYSFSNTCYEYTVISSRITVIIRISCILIAALISGIIYGKIFLIVKKYHHNTITPVVSTTTNQIIRQNNQLIDIRKKDFRLAKNAFILFLSFFLCRLPWVIVSLISLCSNYQFNLTQCYLTEFSNFLFQLTYIATITDPIAYIYSQQILKQKLIRFINFYCKNRIPAAIEN